MAVTPIYAICRELGMYSDAEQNELAHQCRDYLKMNVANVAMATDETLRSMLRPGDF